jgi:hypothetical protein
LLAAGGALALGLGAPNAQANGRYPKADQIVVAADHPEFIAVRTTFGLLLSHDTGQNWDWVCERAIGYSGVQDPTLGLLADGTVIAGLAEGFARTTDAGCTWGFSEADLQDSPVVDLTVRKNAPDNALALVWDPEAVSYSSRFLASDDNGRTFVAYGSAIDPNALVLTLDLAPSDPHRVYASATRTVDGTRSGLLFVSSDDAEHWTEYSLPFDPKLEQGVYIAAVDPQHADTVYVRTSSATAGRLLVSHDAGQHFEVAYSGSLLAFALSPDGSQVYLGGEDGLHAGRASDLLFEKRASLRLLCLAATDDTVYACSDEHSGFTVGASYDGGFTFEPKLHLKTVRGPLACTNDASVGCNADWPLVRAQLGILEPEASDAGADASVDASPAGDAGAATTKATPARSSCSVRAPGPPSASGAWLLALVLPWLSLRCRSRARRRLRAR